MSQYLSQPFAASCIFSTSIFVTVFSTIFPTCKMIDNCSTLRTLLLFLYHNSYIVRHYIIPLFTVLCLLLLEECTVLTHWQFKLLTVHETVFCLLRKTGRAHVSYCFNHYEYNRWHCLFLLLPFLLLTTLYQTLKM